MQQKKNTENTLLINFFLWFLGVFAIWILTYILQKTTASNQTSILLMLIPVILGVVYENVRLGNNWKFILLKIFGSIVLSLGVFHEKNQDLNFVFEDRINIWAYTFIAIFVLVSMLYHKDKTIPKLTEGVTLLHSISFIYWIIDIGLKESTLSYLIYIIVISLSLVTFVHCLSYIDLTEKNRLLLSVWSSIIMIVFSINSIINVIESEGYKNIDSLSIINNTLLYFIIGVSLVYVFKNAAMLYEYFPSKNSNYKSDLKKINSKFINRFSNTQVKINDSIFAILFTSFIYLINYKLRLIPSTIIIWIVFIVFPLILELTKKKSRANK